MSDLDPREWPRYVFHATLPPVCVNTPEELAALGPGWALTPGAVPITVTPPPLPLPTEGRPVSAKEPGHPDPAYGPSLAERQAFELTRLGRHGTPRKVPKPRKPRTTPQAKKVKPYGYGPLPRHGRP